MQNFSSMATSKPDKRSSAKYRVPALEKGLDILEYLSDANLPQSQAELSRALDRSASELFRMLTCLEDRGYIHRDAISNKYQLTLKLHELAHTHSPSAQLLAAAREPMRIVAEQLGESCHVGMLRDDRLVIFAQEESPEPIRISVEVGRAFPALLTASGKLLLSQLPIEELRARLAASPEYASMNAQEREDLHTKLTTLRKRRFEIAESDLLMGVHDTSVLIGNPKIGVTATLAVPILMTRGRTIDQEEILAILQEQATAITRRLGLTP